MFPGIGKSQNCSGSLASYAHCLCTARSAWCAVLYVLRWGGGEMTPAKLFFFVVVEG